MHRQKPEYVIGAARPFTGAQYLESLRDGREVYVYGERVKDVTTHPAFRNSARSIARLYDALHDMVYFDRAQKMLERGVIEVAPLAFMRGRTLNDSFVILDEAQNTTSEQMKMFLTRLGYGSKAVITGDVTQIDLPLGKASGLIEAREILRDIRGIRFVLFSERDVVRHRLVQEIIAAYERVP